MNCLANFPGDVSTIELQMHNVVGGVHGSPNVNPRFVTAAVILVQNWVLTNNTTVHPGHGGEVVM